MPQKLQTSFTDLPPELLGQIVSHVDNARSLASLSRTCKRLNAYLEQEGYRSFVQSNFPSLKTPTFWKEAAHALTTVTKCWDRRALVCRPVGIQEQHISLPDGERSPTQRRHQNSRRSGAQQQSMGFQPVLDSHLEWTGASWAAQRETLAIGAGAELELRVRHLGPKIRKEFANAVADTRSRDFNTFGHRVEKINYWQPEYVQGRDDITSLDILRRYTHNPTGSHHVLVGRASGELHKLCIDSEKRAVKVYPFETNGRDVRSAHVSPAENSTGKYLAAACLSDGGVTIYDVDSTSDITHPIDEVSASESLPSSRTWKIRWLTPTRFAIGRGPSKSPLLVHEVGQSETVISSLWSAQYPEQGEQSVYSIMPISPSSPAGSAENGQFLSGWYAGHIQLHDMRTSLPAVQTFHDPVEPTAVYSLLPFGGERFVVGGSRHSVLKIFDLRMSGQRRYFSAESDPGSWASTPGTAGTPGTPDLSSLSLNQQTNGQPSLPRARTKPPPNFSIYTQTARSVSHFLPSAALGFASPSRATKLPHTAPRDRSRPEGSPVYALTAPTSFSPVFYAGCENRVWEVQLVSGLDAHPDSMFSSVQQQSNVQQQSTFQQRAKPLPFNTLDRDRKVVSLGLVEHEAERKGGMDIGPVRQQSGVFVRKEHARDKMAMGRLGRGRWDYRWLGESGK